MADADSESSEWYEEFLKPGAPIVSAIDVADAPQAVGPNDTLIEEFAAPQSVQSDVVAAPTAVGANDQMIEVLAVPQQCVCVCAA